MPAAAHLKSEGRRAGQEPGDHPAVGVNDIAMSIHAVAFAPSLHIARHAPNRYIAGPRPVRHRCRRNDDLPEIFPHRVRNSKCDNLASNETEDRLRHAAGAVRRHPSDRANIPETGGPEFRFRLPALARHVQRNARCERRKDLLRALLGFHRHRSADVLVRSRYQSDPAFGRPDRGVGRKRTQGHSAGQEPRQFCRVEREALFRHARRLLHNPGRNGKDGGAEAGIQALSRRPLPRLRHGHGPIRKAGGRARPDRASSP